jgi:hypothetical protein
MPQTTGRTIVRAVLVGIATLAVCGTGQAFTFDDSINGSIAGNPIGGGVTADGWKVTERTDRVWYSFPRLRSGFFEITVSGITMATLDLEDHQILAMCEGGYGMVVSSPIQYDPDFRNNHCNSLVRLARRRSLSRSRGEGRKETLTW